MILRGILDQSLGQVCIRGYAFLGDLEKASRADFLFQRNLIAKQKATILRFLESTDLFFPEVILSYVVRYDFNKKGAATGINPLIEIQKKRRFKLNVDEIQFHKATIDYKLKSDSRGTTSLSVITIEINDEWLEKEIEKEHQPFLRIDGNHRLSAAKEFNQREGVTRLVAPFCLILLPENSQTVENVVRQLEKGFDRIKREATKFEKTIFHNINSKSVPLTDEEIYRVIIDDKDNFTETELRSREDFGVEYVFTRETIDKIKTELFPSIEYLLHDKKNEVQYIRTILVDFFTILRHFNLIDKRFSQFGIVERTLKKVEQRYEDFHQLKQSKAHGLLVAFLYFTFVNNKFNLDWFTDWVIENHIYELQEVSPYDLISIFSKLIETKHRTIFISMKFNDEDCENHFEFIKTLVDEINHETKANIKIYPLRIDRFKDGSAYKIPDTILNKIYESGLLIGDLTHKNENVYHEIGYLMGLHRMRIQRKLNLILICNTTRMKFPTDIGFNIRDHKVIPFKDTNKLKEPLKEEIINFYFKNG